MPLLKLFEIIENLFGFTSDEQQYHRKHRLPETTDIYIHCVNNNNNSHSSVQLPDVSTVSGCFISLKNILFHNLFVNGRKKLLD